MTLETPSLQVRLTIDDPFQDSGVVTPDGCRGCTRIQKTESGINLMKRERERERDREVRRKGGREIERRETSPPTASLNNGESRSFNPES